MSIVELSGLKTKDDARESLWEAEVKIIETCNSLIEDYEIDNLTLCGLLFDITCKFREARYIGEEE